MEQATQLLRELADKLGTTVEHLWKVLIQQAQVEIQICHIWMNIGLFGFGGIAVCFLIAWIVSVVKDWDEGPGWLFSIMMLFVVLGGIVYWTNYTDILTLTMNPEYWALNKIVSKLK